VARKEAKSFGQRLENSWQIEGQPMPGFTKAPMYTFVIDDAPIFTMNCKIYLLPMFWAPGYAVATVLNQNGKGNRGILAAGFNGEMVFSILQV
jgi:hypothetical protein